MITRFGDGQRSFDGLLAPFDLIVRIVFIDYPFALMILLVIQVP